MKNPSQSDWLALAAATARTALKLSPCLAVILFVGSYQSRLFGTVAYQLAAKELLAGRDFYGYVNYDERSFQAMMAREIKTPVSVLIAGSSRTMQLEHDCFDGPSYNASESAAMISDFTGVVEAFRRRHPLKHVVFAADPWLINEPQRMGAGDLVRIPAAPDWVRAQIRLGIMPGWDDWLGAAKTELEPFREILAPNTFQTAWKIFRNGRPVETQERRNLFRKEPDGSLRFPDFFINVSEAHAAESALSAANGHVPTVYANFTKFDPQLVRPLETLLADLKSNGIHVTLFLGPFHPAYYDRVLHSDGGKMLPTVEAYFRELGKRQGYEVIGAYNPADVGATASDFFDGVHMKKGPLKRLYGCPEPPRP